MSDLEDDVDRVRKEWAEALPDLETSALEVTGRVLTLGSSIQRTVEAIVADYGIGVGDFSVLISLRRIGMSSGLSPGEITAATMVTGGATTQRLDRLEKAKLIRRKPDPSDRRGQRVHLTAKGTKLAEKARIAVEVAERGLLEALSPGDQASLAHLLKLAIASAERGSGPSTETHQ